MEAEEDRRTDASFEETVVSTDGGETGEVGVSDDGSHPCTRHPPQPFLRPPVMKHYSEIMKMVLLRHTLH